jgi:hypothetical protein
MSYMCLVWHGNQIPLGHVIVLRQAKGALPELWNPSG